MNFIFRDSLNHRFLVHPVPNAVLQNEQRFQPGHLFAQRQLLQQVQCPAPTGTNTTASASSKGKEKPKAADWSVQESKQLLHAWAPRFERLKGAPTKCVLRFGTRFSRNSNAAVMEASVLCHKLRRDSKT